MALEEQVVKKLIEKNFSYFFRRVLHWGYVLWYNSKRCKRIKGA